MPIISSENPRLSALIKRYDQPGAPELFNELVTANEASGTTYVLGTVLGKITATGKYIVCKQAAADGSQTPAAIYIGNSVGQADPLTLVAATDTPVLVLARGKVVVSLPALVLDSSFSTAPQKTAAYAALKALGILAEATPVNT